jgi:hypothetical protein
VTTIKNKALRKRSASLSSGWYWIKIGREEGDHEWVVGFMFVSWPESESSDRLWHVCGSELEVNHLLLEIGEPIVHVQSVEGKCRICGSVDKGHDPFAYSALSCMRYLAEQVAALREIVDRMERSSG